MGNLEGGVVGLGTCGFVGKGLVAAVCFGPDEKNWWVVRRGIGGLEIGLCGSGLGVFDLCLNKLGKTYSLCDGVGSLDSKLMADFRDEARYETI